MNILFTYFTLTVTQISIYLYLKSSLKNLILGYKESDAITTKNHAVKKQEVSIEEITNSNVLSSHVGESCHVTLNKSLRHLEFISTFEMYLENKNHKNFSVEFLQEFEKIKHEAQLTTLKSTNRLTHNMHNAA